MNDTRDALNTVYTCVMEAYETEKRITFADTEKHKANAKDFYVVLCDIRKSVVNTLRDAWRPDEETHKILDRIETKLLGTLDNWIANSLALKNSGAALNPCCLSLYEQLKEEMEASFGVSMRDFTGKR